jgi:hypothetical protein
MSREAMQMALEALESDPISHAGLVNRKQAITALRQALVDADDMSRKRVDEKAKREHEPVAFINVEKQKLEWAKLTSWHTPTIVNLPKIPLYTAPPKAAEWVGLTHPQIHELDWPDGVSFEDILLFVRAIEQALKEKNNA